MNGGTVIADRYTTSNAIHQCAKLPEEHWNDFINWLFHYEYELLGIPEPYRTLYLRVDPEISQKLITKRYQGDENKKDIHESDPVYLRRSREAADYCAKKLGWTLIECVKNGSIRSIDDIAADIFNAI